MTAPNITVKHFTNDNWGYPRGHRRRFGAKTLPVLAVVHITANKNGATAAEEWAYCNRVGRNSFTHVIDRDGSGIECLDAYTQAAWCQGGVYSPNAYGKRLAAWATGHRANPNEGVILSIEQCSKPLQKPTAEQFETVAWLIADAARRTGIAITRWTVLAHGDIDGVNRPNDPVVKKDREAYMAALVARANQIVKPTPPPQPVDPCKEEVARLTAENAALKAENNKLTSDLAEAQKRIADAKMALG